MITMSSIRGKTVLKCKICEIIIEDMADMILHCRSHKCKTQKCTSVEGREFKDPFDKTKYSKEQDVHEQKNIHQEDKLNVSTMYSESCDTKEKMQYHEITHDGQDNLKLTTCKKHFSNEDIKAHTAEKSFPSPDCANSFIGSSQMDDMQSESKEASFECEVCKKQFALKLDLHYHMLTHTRVQTFKCYACDKQFKNHYVLKDHLRIHGKETPFKCTNCEKSFKQKRVLRQHMQLHSKEKLFKCNKCQKSFNQKRFLRDHLRIHSEDKPFKCTVCEKAFRQKAHLNNHILVHTVEKPIKCKKCERQFKYKSSLKRHMRIHNEGIPTK